VKRTMHLLVLVALTAAAAGCAKKSTQTEPTPTPPPPIETRETPTPKPPDEPPTPVPGSRITSEDLQPAFFDLDSYTLRDDARAALDANARKLRENANVNVTIEGHCDERGTSEYNQALGERRAQAASDYLVAAGIPQSRLRVVSYGKERPFDTGHDESAWAKNRRAHFTVQ
jgi:peptidoglycan-associated lipoprotein